MSFAPDFKYELSLLPSDCRYLLGLDEVGRGPWAGPVTIGAFLLDLQTFDPQVFVNLKVRDSKTLSASQRHHIFTQFQTLGFQYHCFSASPQIIDQQGIGAAIANLFSQAIVHFSGQFDFCLIDGNLDTQKIMTPSLSKRGRGEILSLINADARCFSVAAASICAKVTRDLDMDQFDKTYPQYDFIHNKGYGTQSHINALKIYGPCPIHRFSYSPIKNITCSKQNITTTLQIS
jgi:ribonuclease HII